MFDVTAVAFSVFPLAACLMLISMQTKARPVSFLPNIYDCGLRRKTAPSCRTRAPLTGGMHATQRM